MKLRHDEPSPGVVQAHVSGELEVHSCTCLQNFWDLRLSGARSLRLDLSGVDAVDPDGLATFLQLLADQLEAGARVALGGAPAAVLDGLRQVGLDGHERLVVR